MRELNIKTQSLSLKTIRRQWKARYSYKSNTNRILIRPEPTITAIIYTHGHNKRNGRKGMPIKRIVYKQNENL